MKNEIRILVTGDICPNLGLDQKLLGPDGGRYLAAVKPLFDRADLVIGNLETPLCSREAPKPKTGPNFMADPALAAWLKRAGFDGFALANNHILDQDVQGLEQTLRELDAAGLPHCGAGLTHEAACRPAVFTVGGRSIGIFNFAEGEFAQAQGDGPGTARLDAFWSEERIRQARQQFDLILVVLHVGNEYQPIPSGVTVDFCRRMVAAGADAVIAHHAHIPQGTERYLGKPIAFSLGNFLFGYPHIRADKNFFKAQPCWFLSTVAELTFGRGGEVALEMHPFKQEVDLSLAPLSASGRQAFADYIKVCNTILADPVQHARFWEQEARVLFKSHRDSLPAWLADLNGEDEARAHRAATVLFNLFRCEAHHETLRRGFQLAYEHRLADDSATQLEIDQLIERLRACFA